MHKYILGKAIEGDKANSVKDLKDIGKATWEFISSLYEVYWNSLIVDDSKTSFRNKVKSKFSSQIVKAPINVKGKESIKPTYVSSLLPSIPVKSPKKVNEIFKYFKVNSPLAQRKSYTQVSFKLTTLNIAMETLKIKEAFPNLQNKKIKQVQKLISGNSKPKPYINKINPPRLETKKGIPYPHFFKCLNWKGEHQANSTNCLFWKHRFNKK